jgi:chromosome partitioning protein
VQATLAAIDFNGSGRVESRLQPNSDVRVVDTRRSAQRSDAAEMLEFLTEQLTVLPTRFPGTRLLACAIGEGVTVQELGKDFNLLTAEIKPFREVA